MAIDSYADNKNWMWNSCLSGDELVTLSGHISAVANPCVVGVEIRIHRFDVTTTGWDVGGVRSTDREHCASIFLINFGV